jgi:ABC-type Fe3+-hydroxamate transport system substrate-binding protein
MSPSASPHQLRRRSRSRALGLVAAMVALAVLTAACGGTAGDGGGLAPTSGAGPVVFEDAAGPVELAAPAQRVVVLEWAYAEDALVLGVVPVGVADPKGYRDYVGAPPELPDDVADVGTRQSPSLERIRSLDPDLIVGATFRHDAIRDQLEDIAPTALFDAYRDDVTELDEALLTLGALGTALGRQDQAAGAEDRFRQVVADGAEALSTLPAEQRQVVVVQGYVADEVPIVRVFTDDSMTVQLLAELGLVNRWEQSGDEYGFTTTDLEGLTTVRDATLLYTASESQLERVGITENPLWQAWPPVQQGRDHALGGDAWTYGSVASAELIVERVVDALAPA